MVWLNEQQKKKRKRKRKIINENFIYVNFYLIKIEKRQPFVILMMCDNSVTISDVVKE